ncbi:hypothetical protein JW948_15895 [bacterium]|nr:hypothetical protein [bacterium]
MTTENFTEEMMIIRKMIEKTRRDTAESGVFYIAIGLFTMLAVLIIGIMELNGLPEMTLPALIIMTVISGLIGYMTVFRKERRLRIKSYIRTVNYSIWFACAVGCVLTTFILPLAGAYKIQLIPVFSCILIGIGVFSSGVIYESKGVIWAALVWWMGAIMMAFIQDYHRLYVMVIVIFSGWVLPGLILNSAYKKRSREHGSD